MTQTILTSTGNGSVNSFSVPPYISTSHIKVYLDGVLKTLGVDYTYASALAIQFTAGAPANGVEVLRRRVTPPGALTEFTDGALDAADLNAASKQSLYLAEEAWDMGDSARTAVGNVEDAEAAALVATAQAVIATTKAGEAATDRATVAADKATVAADKATVAADKATVAADKATVAADKATASGAATTATTQAGIATTKAGEASTSAAATAADAVTTAGHVVSANSAKTAAELARDQAQAAAGSLTPVETQINAAASDSTPLDTDKWGYTTSTGSALFRITWGEIKTALKSAFEALDWTYTGKIVTKTSATGGAGLNIPDGAAPTSPVIGDIWQAGALLFIRLTGPVTRTFMFLEAAGQAFSRRINFRASITTESSFRIPTSGSDMTSTQAEGDFWGIPSAIRAYLMGANRTVFIGNTKSIFTGGRLTINATDTANDLDIEATTAGDDTGVYIMHARAYTKRADATFTAGNNGGMLDTGVIGNGTYHLWQIMRPDTGASDYLLSTSASAPTMPANYTLKRYMWPLLRTGGSWRSFKMQAYGRFNYDTAVRDRNSTSADAGSLLTLTVPTGVSVVALVMGTLTWTSGTTICFQNTGDGNMSGYPFSFCTLQAGAAAAVQNGLWPVRCNTSAQMRYQQTNSSGTPGSSFVDTYGYQVDRDMMP